MLRTHGRYDYSNITKRPDYTWPGGKRLAVYVAVNIEQFSYGEGKGAAIAPPDQAQSHSIFSWRDYGNRVGVWRLFELFDELGIPAEAGHPEITALPGHCGASRAAMKSWAMVTNSRARRPGRSGGSRIIRTVSHTNNTKVPPDGLDGPWFSNSEVTMDLLGRATAT